MQRNARVRLLLVLLVVAGASVITGGAASRSQSVTVRITSPAGGQTVFGTVTWLADVVSSGTVDRVNFAIDGAVKWTEHYAPYGYGGDAGQLDTTTLTNGKHQFTVTAYLVTGRSASTSISVKVSNGTALRVSTLSPGNGQTVSGSVKWEVGVTGATPSKVVFSIDGVVKWTEAASPYVFNGDGATLDTKMLSNGSHTLRATAYTSSAEASSSIGVMVSNSTTTAPANTAVPTVSGTPQVGQSLTAGAGSWSGTTPMSYAYQWRRCDSAGASCASISGAVGTTYTVTASDAGFTLRVRVTATSSAGSATADSAAVTVSGAAATAPANTALPTVSGTPQVGQTLAAGQGSWSGTSPISYGYQWRRCDSAGASCASISGAAATTYTVTASDAGFTLRARATATNSAGSATADSGATAAVAATAGAGRVDLTSKFGTDLSRALAWLAANPQPAIVTAGVYKASNVLDVPAGADLVLSGVTIVPTNPAASALRLRGSGTKLTFSGVCRIGAAGSTNSRLGNAEAAGIELEGASNFTITADALTIEGVAQDAIFVYRATHDGVVAGNITAINTGADSFHVTDRSYNLDFQAKLLSIGSGDDGFAVVSYLENGVPVKNIHWHDVTVRNQRDGRGVSVVGGQKVTVDHFDVDGSAGAGVYIAAEPQYDTFGVDGVTMTGKIRNPDTEHVHNANVMIYSAQDGQSIANASVTVDPDPALPLVRRTGSDPVSNVKVNGLQVL